MERVEPHGTGGVSPARRGKIDALTGLRFIAAAMIVIHHSRGVLCIPKTFLSGISLQQGVSFFFVLSGFILAYVYPSLSDRRALGRFFVARFARVWPAHIFALGVAVALGFRETSQSSPLIAAANAAMIHAWVPKTEWFFSFNAVSWSISTEFFFYLVFPILIAGFCRTWWWKTLAGISLVAAIIFLCERFSIPAYTVAPPDVVNRAGLLYINPLARLLEFILGMLTAHAWLACAGKADRSVFRATLAEASCVLVCAVAIVWFSSRAMLESVFGSSLATYLHHAGSAPAFAALIFVFASQRGVISRFLAHPFAVLLGEISFTVYLLHQLMIRAIVTRRALWDGIGETLVYIAFWLVLLFASWLVWRFVEKPARRALMRFAPGI